MKKIAIISTRLGGIDGVSVEADKWAKAYSRIGFAPVYIAGKFDWKNIPEAFLIEEMDYYHPKVVSIRKRAFNEVNLEGGKDLKELRVDIEEVKNTLKEKLLDLIEKKGIEILSIENALTIPLNIPLGIALSEILSEKKIKAITRHHDFYWEREQFSGSNIEDILVKYFPPDHQNLKHVVINTIAKRSLYDRKKIDATYIPNIFDFKILKNMGDNYKSIKGSLGIYDEDLLFLQPTRIIARKNIERSIELTEKLSRKMERKIYLFISGKSEKNEIEYFNYIINLARAKAINLILSGSYDRDHENMLKEDIFDRYGINDFYKACDMVTLPSDVEGFGNPVIEACAFKKPLFVNNYPVLGDMLEKGFDFIVIDGKVDNDSVEKSLAFLMDDGSKRIILENNYRIAEKFYSIESLVENLTRLTDVI